MQFKQGTHVFSADDREVGHIDRVVLDPKTKEVSHVVVRKGFLFTEDKVVPTNLIASATDEKVKLRQNAGDLQNLPDFEESHYVPLDEDEKKRLAEGVRYYPPLYWYPPYGAIPASLASIPEPHVIETERNIPENSVALKEGAKVIAADGEHVGDIEQVLTDARTDRVTHFLISQGLLLKEKKLVPVLWLNSASDDEVRLAVGSHLLEQLHTYDN